MDLRLFSRANVFCVSCFLEVDVFCFLTLSHLTLVGIRALTYLSLVANI